MQVPGSKCNTILFKCGNKIRFLRAGTVFFINCNIHTQGPAKVTPDTVSECLAQD